MPGLNKISAVQSPQNVFWCEMLCLEWKRHKTGLLQDLVLLNRFGWEKNQCLQGHSGFSTICLWIKRNFVRAVEFVQGICSISSDFCSDVTYQLRDRNSNCGDSILAEVNDYRQCCRFSRNIAQVTPKIIYFYCQKKNAYRIEVSKKELIQL